MRVETRTKTPCFNYLRQFADEKITNIFACDKTPVIIYCDVKSMHTYNIQYGYSKGDELLCMISKGLERQFTDSIVTRGISDHFIVIDEFDNEEQIAKKIDKVNSEVRSNAYGNTSGIRVGVCKMSLGMSPVEAMDYARHALKYFDKESDIVCHFYSREKDDKYWNEKFIKDSFDSALENGYIRVFYQPILRTENSKITILEALARWIDPEK